MSDIKDKATLKFAKLPHYKVTFKFTKIPYYTITGIEAADKNQALDIAKRQMIIECGHGHKMKKPLVEVEK